MTTGRSLETPIRATGDPYIEVGDVTIGQRDVEALGAVDEHGFMYLRLADAARVDDVAAA